MSPKRRSAGDGRRITLACTKPGCPRTIQVAREDYDPPAAIVARLPCPWHEQSGAKDCGETYYDGKGREVMSDE